MSHVQPQPQQISQEQEPSELVLPPPPPLTPEKLKRLYSAVMSADDAASAAEVALKIDLQPGDLLVDARQQVLIAMAERRASGADATAPQRKAPANSAELASLACGMALAFRATEKTNVVVALLGSAKRAAGIVASLQIALENKLPIVFVADESAEVKRLTSSAKLAELLSISVAAEDVVALYRVGQESIYHARMKAGPTLIVSTGTKRARGMKAARVQMQHYLEKKNLWSGELEHVSSSNRSGNGAAAEVRFALQPGIGKSSKAKRPPRR